MKKILTLALALVLVFAIAAPALAITGDLGEADTTPAAVAPVSLDVALFTASPVYSYNAVLSFSAIAANKAYVVNELAFWGVALKFAKGTLNMKSSDYQNSVLTVSSDAVKFNGTTAQYESKDDGAVAMQPASGLAFAENKGTYNVWNGFWGNDYDLYFFGQGVVSGKGVVKAELVNKNLVDNGLVIYDGLKPLYRVTQTGNRYDVEVLKADSTAESGFVTTYRVGFNVDPATQQVSSIVAAADGSEYAAIGYNVPGATTNVTIPKALGGRDITKNAADAAVFAAYEQVMAFFGFNYTAEGKLLDKHFEVKASGLNLKDEAAVNLYTGSIEIPGGVTPPKTGDAASIMGFAMIVVALVACGVVVSRKVRA